jgi:hypothetical protein
MNKKIKKGVIGKSQSLLIWIHLITQVKKLFNKVILHVRVLNFNQIQLQVLYTQEDMIQEKISCI